VDRCTAGEMHRSFGPQKALRMTAHDDATKNRARLGCGFEALDTGDARGQPAA